jgi:acyl-CoA synthetase (AMP-forming)/AMP-acid ligase II
LLAFPSAPGDRVLSALPHTHAAGISYLMNSVLTGVPIVAMSDWRRRAVEPAMEIYRPSIVVAFPRTYVELATGEPPVTGAARVHTWISTGDRAHDAHVRRLVRLGRRPATEDGEPARLGSRFIDGLGSSELGMSLFQQVTTPESARNDCCIGTPIDVVRRAAVLDEAGRELPDGTPGLLGVRTPTRTPGYWRAPELNDRHELAGYWLSGDVLRRDGEGRFYYLDRAVDVIQTASGPVYSVPMEEVLLADRAELVLDCAVVGVPAERGQAPVAVVVLQPGAEEPANRDLLDTLNGALSAAGLPPIAAVVVARDEHELPTGTTGKVLKRELRERLAGLLTR